MPVTSRAANSNAVVTTGWTSPTNAYGITTDGSYATATPGKNATISTDFGFPNIVANDTFQLAGSWTGNAQGTVTFEDVAYGNGYWVAVGDNGTLYYKSTDPTGAWTQNNQGTVSFNGVLYAGGYWVAIGNSGTLYYTTDPTGTWTSNTQGTQNLWGIAYGGGTWVVVGGTSGSAGVMFYTTDPTSAWTSNNFGTDVLEDVEYDGTSTWVAVGASSQIFYTTSPGGTWTSNTQTAVPNYFTITYGNGYWVAGGNLSGSNMIYTTNPSGAWTSHSIGLPNFLGGGYGASYFMLCGSSGTVENITPDPTGTWTNLGAGSGTNNAVTYGNGYWVVVGASGALFYMAVTTLTGIPDLSTINSVKVTVDWKLSALVTGGILGNQPMRSGVASGTEATQTAIAEAQVSATFAAASLADLRAASTTLKGRIRCTKGSTNSALTGSLDFVRLDVDFTPPVSGSLVYDDKHVKRNSLLRRCVGQAWDRRPSGIFVPDRRILVPQPVI